MAYYIWCTVEWCFRDRASGVVGSSLRVLDAGEVRDRRDGESSSRHDAGYLADNI